MNNAWRSHQRDFLELCRSIVGGTPIRHIVASVTPGGGKSALPVIAGSILLPQIADRICWVVPRVSLQRQGCEAFEDRGFQQMLGRRLRVRAAGNEPDPVRDCAGYVTTYQSLIADLIPGSHRKAFRRHRYILVLDEPHHCPDGGEWAEAIAPLVQSCRLLVQMSGVFQRHDNKAVAFLPYSERAGVRIFDPDNADRPGLATLSYPRRKALAEQAIVPLEVRWFDLGAKWAEGGQQHELISLSEVADVATAKAGLYVALRAGAAREILRACYEDWVSYRSVNPRSRLLVVAASVTLARTAQRDLESWGAEKVGTAVSSDGSAAHEAIARFRGHGPREIEILCTVGMAYEGMDAPRCTHLACLTGIRSAPWVEQMATRSTRVDRGPGALPYSEQAAYLYCPDDTMMRDCLDAIIQEQAAWASGSMDAVARVGREESTPPEKASIQPLGGSARLSELSNLEGDRLSPAEVARLPLLAQVSGSPETLLRSLQVSAIRARLQAYGPMIEALQTDRLLRPASPAVVALAAPPTMTEWQLRKAISAAAARLDRICSWSPGTANKAIFRHFHRSRSDMSASDLAEVWAWLKEKYPLCVGGQDAY